MCLVAGSGARLAAGAGAGQEQKPPAQLAQEKAEARKAAEEDRARAAQEEQARQEKIDAADAKRRAEDTRLAEQRLAELRRLVPLSVQVVVARYQGEKRISSLPYTLAVNAVSVTGPDAKPSQLRMGAKVPVPSVAAPKPALGGPASAPPGPFSFNYQDIGTNIDCNARVTDDGRFQLLLSIDDTSVYTNVADASTPTVGDMPVFRSFRSTNTLVLRDGQTRQFTAATDRVSGEVVRIDVTLNVVK